MVRLFSILFFVGLIVFISLGVFSKIERKNFFSYICETYDYDEESFEGDVRAYVLESKFQCDDNCYGLSNHGVDKIFFKIDNDYYLFDEGECQSESCDISYSSVSVDYDGDFSLFDWFFFETEFFKEDGYEYEFFVTRYRFYEKLGGAEIYRKYSLSMDTSGFAKNVAKHFIGGSSDKERCWSNYRYPRFPDVPFVKG